jgi:hypothetical protein
MAFTDATLSIGAQAIADSITHVSLHTTGAVTSSATESAAARQAISWTVDADGDLTAGPINFTGGAASGAVVRVGYWSASTSGTYRGGVLLTGDAAFNASGEYTVDSITETGTST